MGGGLAVCIGFSSNLWGLLAWGFAGGGAAPTGNLGGLLGLPNGRAGALFFCAAGRRFLQCALLWAVCLVYRIVAARAALGFFGTSVGSAVARARAFAPVVSGVGAVFRLMVVGVSPRTSGFFSFTKKTVAAPRRNVGCGADGVPEFM